MAPRLFLLLTLFVVACAPDPSLELSDQQSDTATELTVCQLEVSENAPMPLEDLLVLDTSVPSQEYFVRWTDLPNEVSSDIEPTDQLRLELACPNSTLYPTHPQQGTKLYHRAQSARYRLRANEFMHADDEACSVGQPRDFGLGYPRCLATDKYYFRLASDTFMDVCGNLYRGFWEQKYFANDETVETLLSLGRTVIDRPGTSFPGQDLIPHWTYPLHVDDFVQLSPLFEGDLEKIATQQVQALANSNFSLEDTCEFTPGGS